MRRLQRVSSACGGFSSVSALFLQLRAVPCSFFAPLRLWRSACGPGRGVPCALDVLRRKDRAVAGTSEEAKARTLWPE
eukprot:8857042-Alexandrium_andersonii.AAC.1